MAIVRIKQPSVYVFEYRQEKSDKDYGECLWARFYFDLENYSLSIQSDCGDYGYSWTPTPISETFMDLMARIDEGYFLDKMSLRNQVDEKATYENIKELIFAECVIDEYDVDRIKEACSRNNFGEVGDRLVAILRGINHVYIEEYDIWQCIEIDFPKNAKRIAYIFVNYIQPKIIEVIGG